MSAIIVQAKDAYYNGLLGLAFEANERQTLTFAKFRQLMKDNADNFDVVETINHSRVLAEAVAATDTTVVLDAPLSYLDDDDFWIAVDLYTDECELRKVTALAADQKTCTVAAMTYTHSESDIVMLLDNPVVNVKWFGAKGDGSTDDSTAIQRAINQAAGNIPVLFPADSNYLVSSSLTISDNGSELLGEGYGTVLTYSGTASLIVSDCSYSKISRMKLLGPGDNNSVAFELNQTAGAGNSNIEIDRLYIQDFTEALNIDRGFNLQINNCEFRNAIVTHQNAGVNILYKNVWFRNIPASKFGVNLDNQQMISFEGCNFSSPDLGGSAIDLAGAVSWAVRLCNFEDLYTSGQSGSPDVDAIQIGNGSYTWRNGVIQDCQFQDLQYCIKLGAQANSSGKLQEVFIRGIHTSNVTGIVDENNIGWGIGGALRIRDKSVALSDVANSEDRLLQTHTQMENAGMMVIQQQADAFGQYQCVQISGWNSGGGVPATLASLANNAARLKVMGVTQFSSDIGDQIPIITHGITFSGKDQSGWTIGAPAYLQDDGTIGNAVGTNTVQIGWIVDQSNPGRVYFRGAQW